MKTYEVWVVRGVLEFGVTVVGFSGLCRYHRTILLGSSNVLVESNDVASPCLHNTYFWNFQYHCLCSSKHELNVKWGNRFYHMLLLFWTAVWDLRTTYGHRLG